MINKNSLTITIDEGLRALDASLVISVLQHSLISSRRCEIEKIMVEEFDALGTELPGSNRAALNPQHYKPMSFV